jgi:hypothetical protein
MENWEIWENSFDNNFCTILFKDSFNFSKIPHSHPKISSEKGFSINESNDGKKYHQNHKNFYFSFIKNVIFTVVKKEEKIKFKQSKAF